MLVRVAEIRFFVREATTRLPFRFGATTMTWAPLVLCEAIVETSEAGRTAGWSSDLLAPKWFDKRPGRTHRDDAEDLLASARNAAAAATEPGRRPVPVFDLWWSVYGSCVLRPDLDPGLRLAAGFGVALVERAVIDAVLRATGSPLFAALRAHGILGFQPGAIHPDLADWDLRRSLPARPRNTIEVRHTVGLADPLRRSDVAAGDRPDDGLPVSLEEVIGCQGVRLFKVKLSGDPARDRERLLDVAGVAGGFLESDWRLSVDANENFADPGELVVLFERLAATDAGRDVLDRLLYVEQPLPRAVSFKRGVADALRRLAAFAPCIIDEADGDVSSFPEAIRSGYRGVSIKNCKGVFRALLNLGLCSVRSTPEAMLFIAPEDLTCLPVVALQQDLATVAALGIAHSERNGHHYFPGLEHLPKADALDALHAHPNLYRAGGRRVSLHVEAGRIDVRSLDAAGFGAAPAPHVGSWIPAEDWRFPEGR